MMATSKSNKMIRNAVLWLAAMIIVYGMVMPFLNKLSEESDEVKEIRDHFSKSIKIIEFGKKYAYIIAGGIVILIILLIKLLEREKNYQF